MTERELRIEDILKLWKEDIFWVATQFQEREADLKRAFVEDTALAREVGDTVLALFNLIDDALENGE